MDDFACLENPPDELQPPSRKNPSNWIGRRHLEGAVEGEQVPSNIFLEKSDVVSAVVKQAKQRRC